MPKSLFSITHLLLAIFFLQLGSGLQGLLVPIRGQMEGFSTHAIGLLGTAYYLGFIMGCLLVPFLIKVVGHIRTFSGIASLSVAAWLVHDLLVIFQVWFGLRVIIGFCFAGLYMAVESWINARAITEIRGRIMAVYMMTVWVAVISGKLIFGWSGAMGTIPFALVSLAISLAVLPVAFTMEQEPPHIPQDRLPLKELYDISPVGAVGCLCIGAANGAFWSLAPIYAQSQGLTSFNISLFMSSAVLGGAITQWPLGKWSDFSDRRWVIAFASLTAASAAGALIWGGQIAETLNLLPAFLFGSSALPLYALCIAHANDRVSSEAFVAVSSALLMMFGIGAILGPILAAELMSFIGHTGVFLFTGIMHLALMGFIVSRIYWQRPVPILEKEAFVTVPRTTQAVFPLDPRSGSSEPKAPESQKP